jgi:hypothetical protein
MEKMASEAEKAPEMQNMKGLFEKIKQLTSWRKQQMPNS